jgi:hypothetical protein
MDHRCLARICRAPTDTPAQAESVSLHLCCEGPFGIHFFFFFRAFCVRRSGADPSTFSVLYIQRSMMLTVADG